MAACHALLACAATDPWPHERLDPQSAAHATLLAEPWVYSREVPLLAANARDYLNVGVVAINRAGQRTYWLGVVAWSTIDRVPSQPGGGQPGRVRLGRPDGSLDLSPAAGGREAVGLERPAFTRPASRFTESWYVLSVDQLRWLSEMPPSVVELPEAEPQALVFEKWRVRRKPMAAFITAIGL